MTATRTTTHDQTAVLNDVHRIREATRRLLATLSAVDADDLRWDVAGPLVSAAADRLRTALGVPVVGSAADEPPIVRERDLSVAAHRLLARDVQVVDGRAAAQFVHVALEIALAFS